MAQRVLVVDDDDLMRTLGARHLARAGFDVTVAGTSSAAMALIGRLPLDAAILDYYLVDGECGCDLIAPLRAANPSMRIAVVSGLALPPEINRHAYRAGADLVAAKNRVDWAALARGEAGAPPAQAEAAADLEAFRRDFIRGTFIVHRRNITRAARALGITRSTLQRALRRTPPPDVENDD